MSAPTEGKASPRPWRWVPIRYNEIGEPVCGPRIEGPEHWHYDGNDSPVIARDISTEANAELIVRAVNAHDEMLAALRAAEILASGDLWRQITAAIRAAEGGES